MFLSLTDWFINNSVDFTNSVHDKLIKLYEECDDALRVGQKELPACAQDFYAAETKTQGGGST